MPLDLSRVDQNLQAIRAIEGSWSLPSLPDEVKLDLAGNAMMNAPALGFLLTGINAQTDEAQKQQALPTRLDQNDESLFPAQPSYALEPKSRVGATVASVTGLAVPQVYDVKAPQRLKQKLVDGGYLNLSPDQVASDQWLPEFSYAASQLNFDEMGKRFSGDKPGSVSVDQILNVVDEWLTPRGLYRAAVELDLWWDAGQISAEFQEWDQKLSTWREDPFDPRKLVDLVTGPLDDILFPALNLALMFTGVGQVIATGRALHMGVKGATALAGVYRGSRGLRFMAQGLDDAARFAKPSWVSGKVAQLGPAGEKTSMIMDQWRKQGGVILAKKANQQVMKAGFTSNLEQLIDSDRGGQSLNRFTGVGEAVETVFSNPLVDWGADLFLMPPNILAPGTFSRPGKAAVDSVKAGFLKAADNENLLAAYDRPVIAYLTEDVGEDAAKQYVKLRNDRGMKRALSETFFEGDDEKMGAALAFTTTMAAVDHHARNAADVVSGSVLHELGSTTRTLFHQARNTATARLRQLDPDNVEDLLTHFAKYGLDDAGQVATRRADRFYRQYRKIREAYLEPAEAAKSRAGSVPSDHQRFIGTFDSEVGRYRWRPFKAGDSFEDDPFFVDLHRGELAESLGDDLGAVLRGEADLPDQYANRYLRRDAAGGVRHWRLSEADKVQLYDVEKLGVLKDSARRHNDLRGKYLSEMMNDVTPEAVEQYVYEVLPTFGRWNDFIDSTGEIRDAVMRGDLDNVRFTPPMSDANRQLAAIPHSPTGRKWVDELFAMMVELPGDEHLQGSLMKGVFSPFARDVDPQMGNFTVAGQSTVTKQQALAFGATAKRAVRMVKAIRRLKALPNSEDLFRVASQVVEGGENITGPGLYEVLAEALGSATEKSAGELAAIARIAREAGVTLDDIEPVLIGKLNEINSLPRWSEDFMVPTQLDRTDDLVKEVDAKIRELQKQAFFMASEVDGAPAWMTGFLKERNYKLVYGVEFAQPFDLDGIMPQFADVARRHLKQKRLGDFFSRQDPEAVSALKLRKVRDSLHANLARVPAEGGRPLNLGAGPDLGNADQNRVVEDLFEILREVQEEARNTLDTLPTRGLVGRVAGRASLARVPFSLDRLASDLPFDAFVARVMGRGYSRQQAYGIYKALQSSQALGFRTHGLYATESYIRSQPNLLDGLRVLGTTNAGDKYRKGRAVLGAIGGGMAANLSIEEGEDPLSPGNIGLRLGGAVLGGVAGASPRVGIPGVKALAGNLSNTKALKYAYLGDGIANLRDMVRFSLSPIFDASRYSEAIILNQIGELPPGLKNLRINQSPKGFRSMVARELRGGGMDKDAAARAATLEWGKVQDEFASAARGYRDFDWEVIDGVGRRFSSVGILGFSPVEWMSSTYGHLRRGGVAPSKAYEVVRDIYTYGTTGRSAAELSMNFVFFPFSFTKKTVGHLSKFFSDDIARLVVLHDMAATFQLLNENYDLSQEWRDRLPILEKANRLNLLAYGVGLGQFGGVNAPIIRGLSQLPGVSSAVDMIPGPSSIVNAFVPQVVPMSSASDADTAWGTVRGLMPVINDVNTMVGALVEQGRVVGSENHMTSRAEARHAWEEWRAFQAEVKEGLDAAGMTWAQATRQPVLNSLIQTERARISTKYPSWKQGLGDGIAHGAAIDMELEERVRFPKTNGDKLLGEFVELHDVMGDALTSADMSWTRPEDVPPEIYRMFRDLAIQFGKEEPEFVRLYDRFFRRSLGDITSDLY
jgi:hypothetical protein